MTDPAIADTINRHVAQRIAAYCDVADTIRNSPEPWTTKPMAIDLMGENTDATNGHRAWLIGHLAARTPGLDFDGPADADWENLFHHLRAEILARRETQTPSVCVAEIPAPDGVGSR